VVSSSLLHFLASRQITTHRLFQVKTKWRTSFNRSRQRSARAPTRTSIKAVYLAPCSAKAIPWLRRKCLTNSTRAPGSTGLYYVTHFNVVPEQHEMKSLQESTRYPCKQAAKPEPTIALPKTCKYEITQLFHTDQRGSERRSCVWRSCSENKKCPANSEVTGLGATSSKIP
jgi:hypothetical protein